MAKIVALHSFFGLFRLALANLRINKLRSALTILGMVFGTGAVIATLSSNEGARLYIRSELEKLGTNLVMIRPDLSSDYVNQEDKRLLQRYSPLFRSVSLISERGGLVLRYESKSQGGTAIGVESNFLAAARIPLLTGRYFVPNEDKAVSFSLILGNATKKLLFGEDNAIGKYVHVGVGNAVFPFQVIGVLGDRMGAGESAFFVPYSTLRRIATATGSPDLLATTLHDDEQSELAKVHAKALLKTRFPAGLHATDSRETIDRTRGIWEKQNLVGICLALISLVTGGVGIMNIMLLSVSQRRREIGLRKAVGATDLQVMLQFLLEAVIVCVLGGLLGIGVGMFFGQKVAQMMGQWKAVISPTTVLLALAFSTLTGIVFGLIPAMRASKLDPYDALRG